MRDKEKARARYARYYAAHKEKRIRLHAEWAKAHREHLRAYGLLYRSANPEKYRAWRDRENAARRNRRDHKTEYRLKWRAANAEKIRAYRRIYVAAWRAANPVKARERYRYDAAAATRRDPVKARSRVHARRALKRGGTLTKTDWLAIVAAWNGCCAYCGDLATTLDHILALKRGGRHDKDNVVPACMRCNTRKQMTLPLDFIWRRTAV